MLSGQHFSSSCIEASCSPGLLRLLTCMLNCFSHARKGSLGVGPLGTQEAGAEAVRLGPGAHLYLVRTQPWVPERPTHTGREASTVAMHVLS